ncbi:MAG: hypothetical protein E7231_14195 [Cellulosilyticum sp.]|nr:hypothetical protein [Cellulosilyticum sp.]
MKIGTDDYVLHIEANVKHKGQNKEKSRAVLEISGSDNAKMTAYVAAITAILVLEGKVEVGVHYLEQLTSLEEVLQGGDRSSKIEEIKKSMDLQYRIQTRGFKFSIDKR